MQLDDLDRMLVDALVRDGRVPLTELASRLGMSHTSIRRRVQRLEDAEVITGYSAVVDYDRMGLHLEGYMLLTFDGAVDVSARIATLMGDPRVWEACTVAGDTDAVVRYRVQGPAELRDLVMMVRRTLEVRSSRTLIAVERLAPNAEPEASVSEVPRLD